MVFAAWTAGIGRDEIINPGGFAQVREFFAAALQPELGGAFLAVVWDATLITLGYAVLGTALAVATGLLLGLFISESWTRDRKVGPVTAGLRLVVRGALVPLRAVHEAIYALLLVQVLGIDPMVAVLSIAVPFGAVTAKVFAQMFDDIDDGPFRALRRSGAGRRQAVLYGLLPEVGPDLIAYGCYRGECAIRAAAVLGVIGAGGLGFQIKLSFQSLEYGEMWTLLYVVIALCAVADWWSAQLRRAWRDGTARSARGWRRRGTYAQAAAVALALPAAWIYLSVDPSSIWAPRAVENFARLVGNLFPPNAAGGLGTLTEQTLSTLAMSIVAIVIAISGGFALALIAARPTGTAPSWVRMRARAARGVLLVLRAIPAPVWAFVFLFACYPGVVPGALALGVYNLGVLGRLMAELSENADPLPAETLRASGARPGQVFWYDRLPRLGPGLAALSVYRWEVTIRETVVVGLVAAGGLGAGLGQQLAAFDTHAVAATLLALVVLTSLADVFGGYLRRTLR